MNESDKLSQFAATGLAGASGAAPDESYFGDHAATLGDRIAAARTEASLTQGQLAERLGVSSKVISGWENDRSDPRANRLTMLSGLLGVSVGWLLTGQGEGVDPPSTANDAAAPTAAMVISAPMGDPSAARHFFGELIGLPLTESGDGVEVNLFGHALKLQPGASTGGFRFECRISVDTWRDLLERLRAVEAPFAEAPQIANVGAADESSHFALLAPGGWLLAFGAVGRGKQSL